MYQNSSLVSKLSDQNLIGHLLTSSNYNDNDKKTTGGRNGYGAKLTNIFSKKFIVETADARKGKVFKQVFSDNLKKIGEPQIKDYDKDKYDFTEVTFEPDLKKFDMNRLDNDIYSLLAKRVYDLAGCTNDKVKVYLNGKKITKVTDFSSYVNMYFKDKDDSLT